MQILLNLTIKVNLCDTFESNRKLKIESFRGYKWHQKD